ncbi:MAG: Na/Pi cotransporter family protein [Bacteroidetes bacterium]|nr:MAG: Na/Pi cotransporter family protein [Bacteroidota bacterium]
MPNVRPSVQNEPALPSFRARPEQWHAGKAGDIFIKVVQLLAVLFLFLLALNLMSGSFRLLGNGFAQELVSITGNPFVSLFIGLLATAVVQSSSTTTTLIVALVASGEISLTTAVPLIMGANIGTSVTSTIVSLGHIANRKAYRLAVAGASIHDFFNILTVLVVFSLEMSTGILSQSAAWLAATISPQAGEPVGNVLFFVKDAAQGLIGLLGHNPYLTLPLAFVALFTSLHLLSNILRDLLVGKIEQNMNRYMFGHPLLCMTTGFFSTVAVQSSTITSSLMVPLVATEKISLERAFPFLMGANVGTTTTALLAALVLGGEAGSAALACACAHLLFNLFGVLILFPFRHIRNIPIRLAEGLGNLTLQNRLFGVGYVVLVFFLLPFLLITFTS